MIANRPLTSCYIFDESNRSNYCAKTTRAAKVFSALTDAPTDTISIVLPDVPHFYMASKAAASTCISNPIDPQTDWRTMASILRAAETKVLVTVAPSASNKIWQSVEQAIQLVPTLSTIIYLDMHQYLSPVERMLTKTCTAIFGWNQLNRDAQRGYHVNCQQFDFDELIGEQPLFAPLTADSPNSVQIGNLVVRYAI